MELERAGQTIRLSGDVDVRSTWLVRDAVYAALHEHRTVVVDLTGATSADLTALRLIAVATRRAAKQGGQLSLRGAPACIRRLLHLSHLAQCVEHEPRGVPHPTTSVSA